MLIELLCIGISEEVKGADKKTAGSPWQKMDQISEEAAQLQEEGMMASAEEGSSQAHAGEPDASVRIILDNSKMGLASHELSIRGSEGIQHGLARIQRGLANINVTGTSQRFLRNQTRIGLQRHKRCICMAHSKWLERKAVMVL